jgi:hypothetical protein
MGPQRTPLYSQPDLQAFALFGLFAVDGLLIRALGGALWLTVLYAGLGVLLAFGRLAAVDRRRRAAAPERVAVGYVHVPAAADRAVLAAHHSAIAAYAETHGLVLRTVVHDVEPPAGEEDGCPALRWALERIGSGDAQVLVVLELAHLGRSLTHLSTLLRWFSVEERALVAIDLGLDTSTDAGRLAAAAVEGVAGIAPRRPAPQGRGAVADRPDLQQRILVMYERGMSLQAIADRLNAEGVPTVRGGALWRPSSVQRAVGYRRPRHPRRGIEVPRGQPDTFGL